MNAITRYLSTIGAKGGRNGTGPRKARSRKHYQAMAKARWSKVKAKQNDKV